MARQSGKSDSDTKLSNRNRARSIALRALVVATLLQSGSAGAQDHVWSQLLGGGGNTVARSVAVSSSGDIVVVGDFDTQMTIGNDSLSTSQFTTDGFVAKFNSSGQPLWAKQFGGSNGDSANGVAIGEDGTVFVVGDVDKDVYVAAFSGTNGAVRWAKTVGGGAIDTGFGVVVNSRGEVIIVAGLQGSGSFGGDVLTSVGSYDIVIASYKSANGAHLWSRRYGGTNAELVGGVAIDPADHLAIVGNFSQSTDIGTGSFQSRGYSDIFLGNYSALDGAPIWTKAIGGSGYDSGEGVAFDPQGNVVFVGYYGLAGGGVNFGGGEVKGIANADVFVAKYSPGGDYLWADGYGGAADDYARDVAVDSAGRVTVTGQFQLTADFGGDPISSRGQIDVFLAQYASNGEHLWSSGHGHAVTEKGLGVAVDPNTSDVVATGYTLWAIGFGGGMLFSQGYADGYLAKLTAAEQPAPTPSPTPDPDPIGVAGQVRYFGSNEAVPSVGVLMQNSTASEWTETGSRGDYSVMGMHEGRWDVEPVKDGDINSAISSLDAAYVLQASVGLRELNDSQRLACDVTGNGGVSSLDAAEILRFVVGASNGFAASQTCGSDWLFIPNPAAAQNQSVVDPSMGGGQCVQGGISLDPLVEAAVGQDFLGVLLGDCSGNWKPGNSAAFVRSRSARPTATVRQLRRTRRDTARLPILIRSDGPVHSVDVQLRYDPSILSLTGATLRNGNRDVVVSHMADDEGRATLAVASAEPLAHGRGILLIVEFDVVASVAARNAVEVIYVVLDEQPAELEQRPASLIRRRR